MKAVVKFLILLILPALAAAQTAPPQKLKDSLKAAGTDSLRYELLSKLVNYYDENNREVALQYIEQCIALTRKNGRLTDLAADLDGKGYQLTQLQRFPEAFNCFQEAKRLAEDTTNNNSFWHSPDKPGAATFRLTVLASIHHDLGHLMGGTHNVDEQIAEYRRTIAIAKRANERGIIGLANMNLGDVYRKLGKLDSGLLLSKNAITIFQQTGFKIYLGWVYGNIAMIYDKKGDKARMLSFYHKAVNASVAQNNLAALASIYLQLSKYFVSIQNADSSLFYAKKAFLLRRSLDGGSKGSEYEALYKSYRLNHQADSVNKYLQLALASRDSSYEAIVKNLSDFQKLSFATQTRLNDLEKEREHIRSRNRTYILLSAITFLLVLALVFYRNNRHKQKANHLLTEQKEEIEAQRDELEDKNHELEVETSLERVRTVAMGMNKANDMLEVCKTIAQQLAQLGLKEIRNVQTAIFYNERGTYMNYEYYAKHDKHIVTETTYGNNEKHAEFAARMQKGYGEFSELHIQGDEVKDWIDYQKTTNVFIDSYLKTAASLHYYWYSLGPVALGVSTYQPLTESDKILFKRFLKVFELSYTRYLDIEQAEAQAREAQIQLGLERVRARAMAMQKPDELSELVTTLIAELSRLDMALSWCLITILDEASWSALVWRANSQQDQAPQSYHLPFADHPFQKAIMQAWKERQMKWSYVLTGDEKRAIDEYMFTQTDYSQLPPPVQASIRAADPAYFYFSFGNFGGLQIGGPKQLNDESLDILARFGKVFDLTYTRFNDLKIAEQHAMQAAEDLIKLQAEKKRTEDALADLRAAQKQLVQAEKMASLGELTAGIAHEIQNPLNFVNNFSEVSVELLEELKEEAEAGNKDDVIAIAGDLTQNLQKIHHHGKRADSIVKGMLEHSRVSTGQKEPTDLNKLADEYFKLSYHGLRAKDKSFNANMKTHFDQKLPMVNVISQDFGRVLLNLFNNAFYAVAQKAKSSGVDYRPEVTVITSLNNDTAIIKVTDNGNGIPASIINKIMQPFFTTKPTGEGTGLGLSLTYDIVVKAHGGSISVDSAEGEGSEFMIKLPV